MLCDVGVGLWGSGDRDGRGRPGRARLIAAGDGPGVEKRRGIAGRGAVGMGLRVPCSGFGFAGSFFLGPEGG